MGSVVALGKGAKRFCVVSFRFRKRAKKFPGVSCRFGKGHLV